MQQSTNGVNGPLLILLVGLHCYLICCLTVLNLQKNWRYALTFTEECIKQNISPQENTLIIQYHLQALCGIL